MHTLYVITQWPLVRVQTVVVVAPVLMACWISKEKAHEVWDGSLPPGEFGRQGSQGMMIGCSSGGITRAGSPGSGVDPFNTDERRTSQLLLVFIMYQPV